MITLSNIGMHKSVQEVTEQCKQIWKWLKNWAGPGNSPIGSLFVASPTLFLDAAIIP